MESCLIVAGGRIDMDFSRIYLKRETFSYVIAVDGGLAAMEGLGLVPDCIIGDFDTVRPGLLEKYRKVPGIAWERHSPEKNETDTELARNHALALNFGRIVFLGATGGRLDHELANLHALYACMERGVEAFLADKLNRIRLARSEITFEKERQWGQYISFLPYTGEVRGLTLTGFKYPLTDRDIYRGREVGLCLSNEIIAPMAAAVFRTGVLVCIESRDCLSALAL